MTASPSPAQERPSRAGAVLDLFRHNPLMMLSAVILLVLVLAAIFAPYLGTVDPRKIGVLRRMAPPSAQAWFGGDQLGRDLWTRALYGARVSLMVGSVVAVMSISIGLLIGMVSGYLRALDAVIMRIMDGLMSIPGILLAIGLVSVSGASFLTVTVAIMIPEIPRVVRLVRSIVLTVREDVEAAIAVGTPVPLILWRHILPNCVPPLIVQATYVAASAMLTEALLSFLGAGTPPEIPSWGNMMAEGRIVFPIAPWIVLIPGCTLAVAILAVNVLGDGLRDRLDPKIAKRM